MATGQSSYSSTGGTTYFDLTTDTGDRAEINDALFFQNKPDDSSGTGLIQAIVRVQDPGGGDGTEDGYNTSFRPLSYEENTSPQFTTSLLLSEVPIVSPRRSPCKLPDTAASYAVEMSRSARATLHTHRSAAPTRPALPVRTTRLS